MGGIPSHPIPQPSLLSKREDKYPRSNKGETRAESSMWLGLPHWKSIEIYRNPLKINWNPLKSLKLYWNPSQSIENPLKSIEIYWKSIEIYWKSIEIYGIPLKIYWNQWNRLKIYWNPWNQLKKYWKSIENPFKSIENPLKSIENLLKSIEIYSTSFEIHGNPLKIIEIIHWKRWEGRKVGVGSWKSAVIAWTYCWRN